MYLDGTVKHLEEFAKEGRFYSVSGDPLQAPNSRQWIGTKSTLSQVVIW